MEKQNSRSKRYIFPLNKRQLEKLPRKVLLEKLSESDKVAEKCYSLVKEFFKDEEYKVTLWFFIENPMLGFIKPFDMFRMNRGKRLLQFIEDARDDNTP